MCVHVLNRGNARMEIFHKPQDYQAFVDLIGEACDRLPMRVLAYGLMPNHFHLVLWPFDDEDVSTWMQWLTTSHVRRYHQHCESSGHVWQGRFKSFPVQSDAHLLTVLRYVERNALRAGLVDRAEEWDWSSVRWWGQGKRPGFLVEGPVKHPGDWLACVNEAETKAELEAIRGCVGRGRPYGSSSWQDRVAPRLGLVSSMRPRGRPRHRKK